MSTLAVNYSYWEFWAPYDPDSEFFGNQKVTFDGENKLITVNSGETLVYVKDDIYSGWKEWIQVRDNAKYEPAFRTTGGDPVGGGLYAGDIYFTINGWKIVVNEQVEVVGIIYDDTPGASPFIISAGGGVRNRVSNLAYAYNTTGTEVPTVQQIRQEMDANSTKLAAINSNVAIMLDTMSPEDFWNYLLTNSMAAGSAGERLKQVLTTGNYLALK